MPTSQPSLVGQSVRSYSADPQQHKESEAVSVETPAASHPAVVHTHSLAAASSTVDDLISEGALLSNDDDMYNAALLDADGNLKSEKQQEQEAASTSSALEPTLSQRLDYLTSSANNKTVSREAEIQQMMREEEEEEAEEAAEKASAVPVEKAKAAESKQTAGAAGSADVGTASETTVPSLESMIDNTLQQFDTQLSEKSIYGYSSTAEPEKKDSYTDSPLAQVKSSPAATTTSNSTTNKAAQALPKVSSDTEVTSSVKKDDPHPPEHILQQDAQFVAPAAAREGADMSVTNSYKTPEDSTTKEAGEGHLNISARPTLATGDSYQKTNSNTGSNGDLSDNTKRYLKTLSKTFSYKSENNPAAAEDSESAATSGSREPLMRVQSYSLTKDDLENEGGLVGASAYDADPSMENTVDKVLEKVESLSISNKGGDNEESGDHDHALEKIIDEVNFEMENEMIHKENPKTTKIPEIKTNLAYDESQEDQEAPKSPLEKLANEILQSDVLNEDVKNPRLTKKSEKKETSVESTEEPEEEQKSLNLKSKEVSTTASSTSAAPKVTGHTKSTVSSIDQIASEIDDLLSGSNSEDPPLTDAQIQELERSLDSDVLNVTKSLQMTNSYSKRPNINAIGSSSNINASSSSLLPQQDDKTAESAFQNDMQQQIINDLKDQPVYIYTSLAAGSLEMIPRTNRLGTILTAYKIPHTYRDLGTDMEARKVWKTYGRGKQLPAVVRSSDIIGDWKEMDQYAEDYEVRKRIYEMY